MKPRRLDSRFRGNDNMAITPFIEVAFPLPLDRTFHYRLPSGDSRPLALGARVLAPFGKQKNLIGYVVGSTSVVPPFQTKEISAWLDAEPFLDDHLLELARWISERYLCSLGEALASMVPSQLSAPKRAGVARETSDIPQIADRASDAFTLSADQKRVMDVLREGLSANEFRPYLLRGITDSGKTELYLRAIDLCLAKNRQALFLLPEIALTPPFAERLAARYPGRTELWHSGLSNADRYRIWTGVRSGTVQVLLGARSAVFAPFPALGLLVIDEEHEPTYKQEDRPRYHTRDVALFRAKQTQSVLILGSATPSMESYWNAQQGIYTLLEMHSRVEERSLPPVTLIDRRPVAKTVAAATPRKRAGTGFAIFSEPLALAIERRLARREQVMLFVNRRGFTPFLRCAACGWVARCPRCSVSLALHMKEDAASPKGFFGMPIPADAVLQCHSCLHQERVPIDCGSCKGMRLRSFGVGTQRIEEEVKRLFPFVKTARLDRDTASKRGVYEQTYRAFASGKVDVLVGTQMIAKGFDFPNVTLVGVVDADVSLHLPDFRSAERTFDLITQVAGRTGRGVSKGQVLVQTHHPEHYALQAAQGHDYLKFYNEEIRFRRALRYPPYVRLISILIRDPKEAVAQKAAEDLYALLEKQGAGSPGDLPASGFSQSEIDQSDDNRVDLLGPAAAPYSRLRNQFRFQILLKGSEDALKPYLKFLRGRKLPKAFMSVDVDPADLL